MLSSLEQPHLLDINWPWHIFYMYPNGGNWNTKWPSIFSHLFNCAITDLTKFFVCRHCKS